MNEERTVTLEEKILHLISLQQEGGYWDFKKQWYEKKNDVFMSADEALKYGLIDEIS